MGCKGGTTLSWAKQGDVLRAWCVAKYLTWWTQHLLVLQPGFPDTGEVQDAMPDEMEAEAKACKELHIPMMNTATTQLLLGTPSEPQDPGSFLQGTLRALQSTPQEYWSPGLWALFFGSSHGVE